MKVLSRREAESIATGLIEEVPRWVLEALALKEGLRERQLMRDISQRLPGTVTTETIAARIDEALSRLVIRGDVERGPGRIYRCVPPYLVEVVAENRAGLRLHGDPRAERDVLKLLRPFGVVLQMEHPDGEATNDSEPPPKDISLERFVALKASEVAAAVGMCEAHGYTVLRPSMLASTLPGKEDLLSPAESLLSTTDNPGTGAWEAYDPSETGEGRWKTEEGWRTGDARLVRWRPADDWAGEWNARVFYHNGHGRTAQLGREAAALWQFYLDAEAENPRVVWWDGEKLWVPTPLPIATLRWVELLAGCRARLMTRRAVLGMDERSAREVQVVLTRTLGVTSRSGRPPYEGRRRRQSESYEETGKGNR